MQRPAPSAPADHADPVSRRVAVRAPRLVRAAFVAAVAFVAGFALPASATAAAPAAAVAPPPPPAPPPSVSLTLVAPSAHAAWRMRVTNTGEIPVRLTADARLLSFDLFVPDVRAPLHCALPADMRPTNDVDRALVLPSRRSYSEVFDPRLYCFGAREAVALAPGTTVVAHLGFSRPAPPSPPRGRAGHPAPPPVPHPPFEVSPLDGVEPLVSPLTELVADQVTLPVDPTVTPPSSASPAARRVPTEPFPTRLSVTVPAHIEAFSPFELAIPITVQNDGSRPVTFLFRPETVGFDVIGPVGSERCGWPTSPGAPIREMYTTLAPGARATRAVLLENECTGNSLDQGGLFIVRPRLDTRGASGGSIGLRTFDGEVLGTQTLVLRLHRGKHAERETRPRLDPPANPQQTPPR